MLVSCFDLIPLGSQEQDPRRTSLFGFRLLPLRRGGLGYPADRRPIQPRGLNRWDVALSGQGVVVVVGDYQWSYLINEGIGTSACNLDINCPRRNLFAPLS